MDRDFGGCCIPDRNSDAHSTDDQRIPGCQRAGGRHCPGGIRRRPTRASPTRPGRARSSPIGVYSAGQRGAISGPLYFWRNKFEELTGATYDIVEIPFAELPGEDLHRPADGSRQVRCDHQLLQLLRRLHRQRLDPAARQVLQRSADAQVGPRLHRPRGGQPLSSGATTGTAPTTTTTRRCSTTARTSSSRPKWQAAFKKEMGHDMPVKMDTWEEVLEICQVLQRQGLERRRQAGPRHHPAPEGGRPGLLPLHGPLGAVRGHPQPGRADHQGHQVQQRVLVRPGDHGAADQLARAT